MGGQRGKQTAWRPMPIHNKGEVFNEWGAVIQQQDEIDQEMMRREQ